MNRLKVVQCLAVLAVILGNAVNGQINTPCTSSTLSNFTPCLSYITGSSSNGSSPTESCCSSLSSLMDSSRDCVCLVITANVPLKLPINRTLALSLPQACNMGGVPMQCKATGTPLPAPGPVPFLLGPSLPPTAASASSPRVSKASSALAPAPVSQITLPLAPASSPVESQAPTKTPGIRSALDPSTSSLSYSSPSLIPVLLLTGLLIFKCY